MSGSEFNIFTYKYVRPLAEVVQSIQRRIAGNQQITQTLTILRDTLLPRLISGQLRLPDAEALNIYQERELDAEATTEDFSVVQKEGM